MPYRTKIILLFGILPILLAVLLIATGWEGVEAQTNPNQKSAQGALTTINRQYHRFEAAGYMVIQWSADPIQKPIDRMLLVVDSATQFAGAAGDFAGVNEGDVVKLEFQWTEAGQRFDK